MLNGRRSDKIRDAILSAIRKSSNLQAALPPSVAAVASIRTVRFADAGAGRLSFQLTGDVRIPPEQAQALIDQLKAGHR